MTEKVEVIRTEHIIAQNTVVKSADGATLEEWQDFGLKLAAAEKYVQWYLGYWWNYGHKKWNRKAEEFIEKLGYERHTLETYGWVYNALKPSIRVEDLKFNHHRLVAPLSEPKQITYLKQANNENLSIAALRKVIRKGENPPVPIPKGKYRVIYADPPWFYAGDQHGKAEPQKTVLETHYTPMDLEDICAIPVKDYAHEDSVLFLWVTSPKIFEAREVIEAWGFTYKAMFVWDKVKHNVGGYNSVRHELLLICTRGDCKPDSKKLIDSVQTIERSQTHSEKPERFREIIDEMYTTGPKIELFARKKVKGWTYYGKQELGRSNHLLSLSSAPHVLLYPKSKEKTRFSRKHCF